MLFSKTKSDKKPYIKRENFLEPFEKADKIKGLCLFLVYAFGSVFGGSLLIRTGVPLIMENMTFFVYLFDFIAAAALFWKMYFRSFRDIKEKDLEDAIGIFGIFVALMVAAAIFLSMGLGIEDTNSEAIENDIASGGIVKTLIIIPAVFFAPFVEETAYRFFLFRLIRGESGWVRRIVAHIFVSAMFAFSHCWDYVLIGKDFSQLLGVLPLFIIGLGFSIAYDKTKNLALPIIMHMALNSIASM